MKTKGKKIVSNWSSASKRRSGKLGSNSGGGRNAPPHNAKTSTTLMKGAAGDNLPPSSP